MLSWLRCFDAAARCESFTQAASVLCITQGAVSQQVKQLELWLQRPLFLRSPRALLLTPEGKRLALVLRESFDALEATLLQLRKPAAGAALALSCSPSFAMGWLTPRLGDFFRQHATLDLRVISEFQDLDRQRMAQLGLAAAVRYDPGAGYTDLQASAFLDEWLLPVASPAWLTAHPEVKQAGDLRPEHLLHDDQPWDGAGPHDEWQDWLRAAGLSLDLQRVGGRHFNLSQLAVSAALAGQGVAMGRAALVLDELAHGRLVAPFAMATGAPALRSRASYQFVVGTEDLPGVAQVREWLATQAAGFVKQRDAVLARLAPGA